MPFLLTTEPWIPCRTRGGEPIELGLVDVLSRAPDLESVHDGSPLVTLALHRLLLAILHRTFGPPDLQAWTNLFARGSFDQTRIAAYAEAHVDRFDLLHAERPFYQVRGLTALYEPDGLRRLLIERSAYGASVNVFQHRPAATTAEETLSFAAAARAVVALQAFVPGGLVKKKDEPGSASAGPLNRGAFVLVHGASLFETLMLNLLVYDPDNEKPVPGVGSEDLPSWEQPAIVRPLGSKEPTRKPRGWIDWLTWQSRRLELTTNEARTAVRGVVHCVGHGLDDEGLGDPMLPYRVDKVRGPVAIDLTEDRATWRDCHAFVRAADADGARAPAAVIQLGRFELRAILSHRAHFVLDILGMRGDQAAIKLTRHERMTVPTKVLVDADRAALLGQATRTAEDVGLRLTYAIRDAVREILAPGARDPDAEDVRRITDAIGGERTYWASLSVPFERLLDELAERDAEAALARFKQVLRHAAERSLRVATEALGTGAPKLKGAAIAETKLRVSLNELVPISGGPS